MKNILLILFIFFFQYGFAQKKSYKLQLIYEVNNPENFKFKKNEFLFKDTAEIYQKLAQIKTTLIQKSYLAASIDRIVKDSTDYYAYLYIGKQYRLQINIDSIEQEALKYANIKSKTFYGNRLSVAAYLKKRNKILEYYDNKGYPFAEIYIHSLKINQNQIFGNLKIKSNRKFYFDSLYIKSKIKISPKFIYRRIGIKPGDSFSGKSLNRLDENINRINFIATAKASELEFFPEKVDLYLYLKPKKSNFFSGIIGFTNSDNKPALKLTGNILLDLNNSLGIGENISLNWESYADSSQYLHTKLKLPYLFFLPLGFAAGFELDKRSADYFNINYRFSLSYDFTSQNGIDVFYQQRKSFLINDTMPVNTGSFNNFVYGMQISVNTTERLYVPQKGFYISMSTAYGLRSTNLRDEENIFETDLQLGYYWQISPYFNLLLRNVSSGIFNKAGFYTNELYRIGGLKTVRGFDEKSILASSYSIFTLEPRFFIGAYSFFSLFVDYLYYQQKIINTRSSNNFAIAVGSGINIDTRAGIFSINFALGSLNKQQLRLSNTKVHIAYILRF